MKKKLFPLEFQMSSQRLEYFDEKKNIEGLHICIDIIDKLYDLALPRTVSQKQAIARRYYTKVKKRSYRMMIFGTKERQVLFCLKKGCKLGANWEGP